MAENPSVIVLAGPNGAGKTTASRTVLAESLRLTTFVNADVIAQGLAGFDPDSAAVEASRIMLDRLHALAAERTNFAFETTLAGRSQAGWLKSLRDSGYTIELIYLWLADADLAVARVAERVRMGGHNVPEVTIRQRYRRSQENLFRLYIPIVNLWKVFDSTEPGIPKLVAFGESAGTEMIVQQAQWQLIKQVIE
jgi:predicted ABC-type ATPase